MDVRLADDFRSSLHSLSDSVAMAAYMRAAAIRDKCVKIIRDKR